MPRYGCNWCNREWETLGVSPYCSCGYHGYEITVAYITADDLARRARLQAAIDRREAERGRPLTDRERLQNLQNALIEHDPDCAVHLDSDRKCNCRRACPVCGALIPLDAHDGVKLSAARAPNGFCPHCHEAFPDVREGDDDE